MDGASNQLDLHSSQYQYVQQSGKKWGSLLRIEGKKVRLGMADTAKSAAAIGDRSDWSDMNTSLLS